MNLQTIRNYVRYQVGADTNDAQLPDDVIYFFINAAIREVSSWKDWDWLVSTETIPTVAGTAAYDVDSNWRKTLRLYDETNDRGVQQITPRAADAYRGYTGDPSFFYVQAGDIVLVPTPARVVTLTHTFQRTEADLVGTTDTPLMPDWVLDLVVIKASIKAAIRLDNGSLVQSLRTQEKMIAEAIEDDVRQSKGTPLLQVRTDWHV